MDRVTEAGLYAAIAIAVIAFGGASAPFFLVPQLIVSGLAVCLLIVSLKKPLFHVRLPFVVPLLLITLVLLQIFPFPNRILSFLGYSQADVSPPFHPVLSIAPYETVSQLLLLVTYLAAFYLVLFVCEDRNARRRFVYALIAIGTFEALYGLMQYLTGWQQIFSFVKKYYLQDATGTYINRNHFAGLLEMTLPLVVAMALRQTQHMRHKCKRENSLARDVLSGKELPAFVFWLFLAALLFTALFFSRSRMGLFSAVVSLIVILAFASEFALSVRSRILLGAVFMLSVAGIAAWVGTAPVLARFETIENEYAQTGWNRVSVWRDTGQLIREHPYLGTGLGTFSEAYPSVQTAYLSLFVDHAHSDYLEIASDIGLPGAILLFGSIFWILGHAIRRCGKLKDILDSTLCLGCAGSIVAILVHSIADFNLHIPANALIFTVLLALAVSVTRETKPPRNQTDPLSGWRQSMAASDFNGVSSIEKTSNGRA